MISWILGIKGPLSIISGSATMKFNTALLFFLTSFCLALVKNKNNIFKPIYFTLSIVTLLISVLTIFEHLFDLNLIIDNLFVKDQFSKKFPGRMSLATSVCFVLLSIGLIGLKSKKSTFKKASQNFVLITMLIAFVSVVTYVLRIPAENKTFFFDTMAIHTSLLFVFLSILVALKTPKIGFIKLFLGKLNGSVLLRKIIPFIILIPFLLSFILSALINKNIVETSFGIIIYTVVLILIGIIYTAYISFGLNKSDHKRKFLEDNIIIKNQELVQYKNALDKIAIISITDNKGIIKNVNNNFCVITKYSEEELIGASHSILNSNFHDDKFYKNLWETITKGENWSGEFKNKAKDGSLFWESCAIIPFKNKNGTIYQFMSIKQDITQRKEAEDLLASKYVKKLETKNKELEQFAYIASHDLQEPLRTITSFSEILHTEYGNKLDEQAKISFKFIQQATGRMSALIKGLLDYSRLGYEQELTAVNCNIIIKNIITDLNTTITQTNTTIETGKLPEFRAYETGIRLLFQNLITNAIKFRKKDISPIIKINAIRKGDFWEFSVEDNGIGIAKEFQKKIFAIFQRLHLKNEYEGTGIGLAHCQKIVNLHDGEIWVESVPKKGSKFYFTILNEQ